MNYCRLQNVIPNITINGKRLTKEHYKLLKKYCGAVAVSLYEYNDCYNVVYELSKDLSQVNIHALLSEETFDKCMKVLKDSLIDK